MIGKFLNDFLVLLLRTDANGNGNHSHDPETGSDYYKTHSNPPSFVYLQMRHLCSSLFLQTLLCTAGSTMNYHFGQNARKLLLRFLHAQQSPPPNQQYKYTSVQFTNITIYKFQGGGDIFFTTQVIS